MLQQEDSGHALEFPNPAGTIIYDWDKSQKIHTGQFVLPFYNGLVCREELSDHEPLNSTTSLDPRYYEVVEAIKNNFGPQYVPGWWGTYNIETHTKVDAFWWAPDFLPGMKILSTGKQTIFPMVTRNPMGGDNLTLEGFVERLRANLHDYLQSFQGFWEVHLTDDWCNRFGYVKNTVVYFKSTGFAPFAWDDKSSLPVPPERAKLVLGFDETVFKRVWQEVPGSKVGEWGIRYSSAGASGR